MVDADVIRAEGRPLGRWSSAPDPDPERAALGLVIWYQTPDGTHDAFEWRFMFHTLPRNR